MSGNNERLSLQQMIDINKAYGAFKILVSGEPKTFKTTTVSKLDEALHIFYDTKSYPFKKAHRNVPKFGALYDDREIFVRDTNGVIQFDAKKLPIRETHLSLRTHIMNSINKYAKKLGKLPKVITLDAMNKMYDDAVNFLVYSNYSKDGKLDTRGGYDDAKRDTNAFQNWVQTELVGRLGISVVYIMHSTEDDKGNYGFLEYGKFKQRGGWLGAFGDAIYLEKSRGKDNKPIIKAHLWSIDKPARTSLPIEEMMGAGFTSEMALDDFDFDKYIDTLRSHTQDLDSYSF